MRLIAFGRNGAFALAARIERDDPPGAREIIDLALPDPGRHPPARHQHDGSAASGLDIMQADMVGGLEIAMMLRDALVGPGREGGQTSQEDCDQGAHAVN